MPNPIVKSTSLKTVSFVRMADMTLNDAKIITDHYEAHESEDVVTQVLGLLHQLKGPTFGYQIDRFDHSLQCATRALRNGEPDEIVVAALLHDVGESIAPWNHSAVAAEILKPYVEERTYWIVRHHGLFQGYYYRHLEGGDRNERDMYRDHQWFDDCVAFCQEYDQNCFEPDYDELPVAEFEPLVSEFFKNGLKQPGS
ncbi:MAG: HD domain-containing protein [Acidimicrobiales bacterium]|nr:HD domain-containing protein [Acidimicrobiales bacterium]